MLSNSLWGQYYDKFGPKWLMKSSIKSSKSHSRLGFVSCDEWRILLSIFFVSHLTQNGSWTNEENELRIWGGVLVCFPLHLLVKILKQCSSTPMNFKKFYITFIFNPFHKHSYPIYTLLCDTWRHFHTNLVWMKDGPSY